MSTGVEQAQQSPFQILLVEDNPADVNLTTTALRDATKANNIHVVADGEQALAFLMQEGNYASAPRPDLVLLDLNLPMKDGFQVLEAMKANTLLNTIPVIVVSGSDRASDIARAYRLQVSAYLVKPLNVGDYFSAIRSIKELWFHSVALPPKESEGI